MTNASVVRHAQNDLSQRLRYLDGGWYPLPDWALFFIALGTVLAVSRLPGTRLIGAVSAPTRGYAAALAACGVVSARATDSVELDALGHLAYLRSLPPGTTVNYRHGKNGDLRSTGWLAGFANLYGNDYIVINDTLASRIMIMASKAHYVEPAPRPLLNLPTRHRASVDVARLGLLTGLLGHEAGNTFARDSRLECLIVGNKSILREEIVETAFAVEDEGDWARGRLQDLLRVRSFLDDANGHRSEVISIGARLLPVLNDVSPSVVIFDGATSFLRWQAVWPDANSLIVLDRTERCFLEAVATLDSLYIGRIPDKSSTLRLVAPPSVEWIAFAVRAGG